MHPTPPPPQERGTKISHANTAKLALQHGDRGLSNVCTAIANDEARHESEDGGGAAGHAHARGRHASTTNPSRLLAAAYKEIVGKLFESDPEGTLMAFSDMMKKGIVMPAHLVDDGWHAQANGGSANLFSDYAMVAERTGVYTAIDYASIVDHLVRAQGGGAAPSIALLLPTSLLLPPRSSDGTLLACVWATAAARPRPRTSCATTRSASSGWPTCRWSATSGTARPRP